MTIDDKKAELGQLLKIEDKEARIADIKKMMEEADFWSDHARAAKLTQEMTKLQDVVDTYILAEKEEDLDQLMTELYFSGEHDNLGAYISIYAGSGGTEAMDWAGMLLRMYLRWGERKGYQIELLDKVDGEEAGIKSATVSIKGFRAYGYLKSEHGTHRLVRISPFDADKARHTSFAGVEITPEIENTSVEINNEDLKIDVYRSGGHGGQGVNTTDSAVRLTHLPTGIVVTCQNERSQLQNKAQAMKVLEAKLAVVEEERRRQEMAGIKGEVKQASWGNQIRSYVFMPYQMVKDLRTNHETSQIQAVMDGDLDDFMISYLKWLTNKEGE